MIQCSYNEIRHAAVAIKRGELVAFPTETVYGLGADATSDAAVANIYAVKGRPHFNPLIVHVASIAEAEKWVEFTPLAQKLATAFWPGGLTLVLNRRADCGLSLLPSAGLETVAVRVPAHPIALALLAESACPIAAPSANISGRISPTTAAHVHEELGDTIAAILEGGACEVGLESTVLDARGAVAVLLRPGAIPAESIIARVGAIETANAGQPLASPGMLESHYAPNATLRLNALDIREGESLLAFGDTGALDLPDHGVVLNLSRIGNTTEAAANLFAMLRALDKQSRAIAVMPIPHAGLGRAINDRLMRAAAPK